MNDVDKLLYEKANTYRLHADSLRWTLLGGYGAFSAAAIFQLKDNFQVSDLLYMPDISAVTLSFMLFFISILYLFILAVQSWYYNLFSAYVEYCEEKLMSGKRLESLKIFSEMSQKNITPLHPAFTFALYIIALTSMGYLFPLVRYLIFYFRIDFQQNAIWLVGFAILSFVVYVSFFNLLFRRWQTLTYPIIAFLFLDRQERPGKAKKH